MTEETIKCPKCGTENNVNNDFCQECGAKLKENAVNVKISPEKKLKKHSFFGELVSYFIFLSIFATVISFLIMGKLLLTIENYDSDNALKQIYNAIEVVGCGVSVCIGIVVSFFITAYIRMNKKLNDIYNMLNK